MKTNPNVKCGKRGRRGAVILYVIIAMVMVAALGSVILGLVATESQQQLLFNNQNKAFYLAWSGFFVTNEGIHVMANSDKFVVIYDVATNQTTITSVINEGTAYEARGRIRYWGAPSNHLGHLGQHRPGGTNSPMLGDGTNNPWQIEYDTDITAIGVPPYSYSHDYMQTFDIDMSGIVNFDPIGAGTKSSGDEFVGEYDGNGFEIRNLTISNKTLSYVGLFATIGSSNKPKHGIMHDFADVHNVTLVDVDIYGKDYVGGLAGGITDKDDKNVAIKSCAVYGRVRGRSKVGGLIGAITYRSNFVHDCYSRARVEYVSLVPPTSDENKGKKGTTYLPRGYGGLIGGIFPKDQKQVVFVSNCYANGRVTAPTNWSGLIGNFDQMGNKDHVVTSRVDNSYYDCTTNAICTVVFPYTDIRAYGAARASTQMTRQVTYVGWDFNPTNGIWLSPSNNQPPKLRMNPLSGAHLTVAGGIIGY